MDYRMYRFPVTLNDLEGRLLCETSFLVWNLSNCHISEIQHVLSTIMFKHESESVRGL